MHTSHPNKAIQQNGPISLSVVSPVYRAEGLVGKLVAEIRAALEPLGISYEIILVEDASPDKSWEAICECCEKFAEVRGVLLSRNFGQHYAISAGLTLARGDWVVVMDCDLQDRPAEIPRLLQKAAEGYDVVVARRAIRQDGFFKKLSSRLFYGTLGWLTGTNHDPAIANFGIYSAKVIAAINSMPESIRYFPTMVRWVGFRTACLDVEHAARTEGKTSYNLRKLFNLALDICLAYSDKPLRMAVGTGFVVSLIGFVFAGVTVVQAFRGEIQVLGYASLIVSLWVLAGLLIFIMGVVGLYVGKCFEGVKRRPAFIIAEEKGATEPDKRG
ncbi:MAG: glycosyltransferase family 2 protein [Verrucomicrobia bacterium]|nr:glycosyltransferase family 2 protein [Verrucomicrobiota bacterium]